MNANKNRDRVRQLLGIDLPEEVVVEAEDLVIEGREVVDTSEEDGSLRWLPDFYIDEDSLDLRRVKQIRDVINHGIEKMLGDVEVADWVKKLGGIEAINQRLLGGVKTTKKSWYGRTCQRLKEELGYEPRPIGDALPIEGVESATSYSSYAVEAHRTMVNRKAYGQVHDMEELCFTPDWEAIRGYQDLSFKPFWWKGMSIGRFSKNRRKLTQFEAVQVRREPELDLENNITGWKYRPVLDRSCKPVVKPTFDLIQVDGVRSNRSWMLDIRVTVGELPSSSSFKHISDFGTYSQMLERPKVKEFIDLFYNAPGDDNDPNGLMRFRIGGDTGRWAMAMKIKGGWIWAPLSKKASSRMDYFMGPKKIWDTYDKTYWVKGDDIVRCRRHSEGVFQVIWERQVLVAEGFPRKTSWALGVLKEKKVTMDEWITISKKLAKTGWQKVLLKKGTVKLPTKSTDQKIEDYGVEL